MAYFLISQYGPVIIDEILKSQVQTQTDGRYVIDYSRLEISVWNKRIEITNFELNKKYSADVVKNEDIYAISVPRIEIGLSSILDIYFGKELKITGIKVFDPGIEILKTDALGNKTSTLSIESGSMYNAISNYLSTFSVDQLNVANASVQFNKQSTSSPLSVFVNQIDFSISNFLLDSIAPDRTKFLYTDNIELVITNQTFALADSIHDISFESFQISTKTGNILFKNLLLRPNAKTNLAITPNFVNISIPELNFRGLDFSKAYSMNKLNLDSIRILNPRIVIERKAKNNATGKLDLIALSTVLFDQLDIGKLYLDNAYLDIVNLEQTRQNRYRSTDVDIVLHHVNIDTNTSQRNRWSEVFTDLTIDARTFDTYIMDSSHHVSADHFSYSSIAKSLILKNFQIEPIGKTNWKKPLLRIQTEMVEGHAIASISEILKGNITAENITLLSPKINVRLPNNQGTNQSVHLHNSFVKSIQLDTLNLSKANVTFKKGNIISNVSNLSILLNKLFLTEASLQKIQLNKICPKSTLNWDNLKYVSDNISLDLNKSQLKNWSRFTTENVSVLPANTKTPYTFDNIEITAFDFDHFINNKLLAFDTLIINKPNIELFQSKNNEFKFAAFTQWAHHTQFKEVKVTNGTLIKHGEKQLQMKLTNFDAELSKFRYDSITNQYYTLIGYRSDSIYLHLQKLDHALTGTDVSISIKDSTFDIRHLKIVPLSNQTKNRYNVSSYELKLREIDFHHLINKKQLHFYEGYLISPTINILTHAGKQKKNELEKSLLKFNLLSISNAKLTTQILRNDSIMTLDVNHANLLINGFNMGDPASIFGAQNYLVDIQDFSLKPFSSAEKVNLKKAFINTREGNIVAHNISFSPSEQISINVPQLTVKGFKPLVWATQREIDLDSLIIDEPKVAVNLDYKSNKNDSIKTFPSVKVNFLTINNGSSFIMKDSLNFDRGITLNHIDFSVDSLVLNKENLSVQGISNHLPRTSFSIRDFEITTLDSLYNIRLEHLSFGGKANILNLTNTSLDPIFNKEEFQLRTGVQKDWLDIQAANIALSGLNARELIDGNGLELKEISIIGLVIDTHKDKRLPLPPNLEKPLPQEIIRSIPLPIEIEKINVENGYVSHSEFSPTGKLPGNIFFQKINGQLSNVTNKPSSLAKNPVMSFESSGVMMETGTFDLNVHFDLMDSSQFFYLTGHVREMNLKELNRFLENTAHVQIKDGYNKYVHFDFEANHDYAIGTMKFFYEDLKIRVLSDDTKDHTGLGSSIKSFFANTFVVNKKNPNLFFVREGNIFHQRDLEKGIFNYWAKGLLSGVVSSIGAKNNKKEIKELNDETINMLDLKRAESSKRMNAEDQ